MTENSAEPGTSEAPTPGSGLLLGIGLLLGLAADRLLWLGPLGPGFTLWMALLGGAAVIVARRQRWPWSGAVAGWSVVAVVAVAGTVWRASPVLNLLYLGTALLAASGALLAARGIRLGKGRVLDHVWGLALVPWHAVTGAFGPLVRARAPAGFGSERAVAVGRGVLLAIPPILVFGALFASADPAFERAIDFVVPDIETLPAHLFLFGFFGWVGTGLLTGLGPGRQENPLTGFRPPKLGVETTTALALVTALFAAFVAIQFSYLFGGASAIEGVSGLTVADYARRGFFELVAVAGLVTVLLLAANVTTDHADHAGRRVFRILAGVLVALVMVIIASAGLRLRLYVDAFGLTDARFLAAAVMAWIAVTLLLFAGTVLRDRPRPFASGTLMAGLLTVALLTLANPDAAVARTNIDRAVDAGTAVDTDYLASLSADAAPEIVPAVLDEAVAMAPDHRCALAGSLIRRWGPEAATEVSRDWRRWNAAVADARERVATDLPELRAAADRCDRPAAADPPAPTTGATTGEGSGAAGSHARM